MGRALHSIAAPEPPPAPLAGFRASLQPKTGNQVQSASLDGFDHQVHPIRFRMACPVAVNEVTGGSWKMLRGPEIRDWASPAYADADLMGHSAMRMGTLVLELARDAADDSQIAEKKPASGKPAGVKKAATARKGAAKDVPPAAGWMTLPPAPVEAMLVSSSALDWMAAERPAASIGMPAAVAAIHLPVVTGWAAVPAVAVESMVLPASQAQPLDAPSGAAAPQLPFATPRNHLPVVTGWASLPPAPVETMLPASSAMLMLPVAAAQMAAFDVEAAPDERLVERTPQLVDGWAELERVAMPPAAPVSLLESIAAPAAQVEIAAALELGNNAPVFCDALMPLPPAAVESMVLPGCWLEAAAFAAGELRAPALPAMAKQALRIADHAASAPPVEVACFVRASWAAESAPLAACVMPSWELAITGEELAAPLEELVEVVDMCEQFFAAAGAQPVERMLSWTAAEMADWTDTPAASPLPLSLEVADTFMPAIPMLVRPPAAEPAEVAVFPAHAAEALVNSNVLMTGIELALDVELEEGTWVEGAQPAAAESMPAAQRVEPAAFPIEPVVPIAESAIAAAGLQAADTVAGNGAAAVESMVFPIFHGEMMTAISLALPMAAMEIAGKLATAPETGAGARALPVPQLPVAQSTPAELQPIRKLALVPPEARPEAAPLTIPRQGFHALQSYTQRPLSTVSRSLEWILPAIELIQPPFAMRPLADKVEDTITQKKPAKKPAMAEIFSLPEAKKKAVPRNVYYAIKAIAACLVVGGILWVGSGALRQTPAVNHDVAMLEETAETAAADAAAAAAPPASAEKSAKVQPHGPLAKLRKAIAERAASTVTDGFHGGMEAWGAKPKTWAAGWSRHPEGYVQPGQLALFHPSLTYKDYRLEFFGQIDNKSMGWTVRSKDAKNYYAMKFTVVEPGLRPIIAMVHYPVVDGKRGRQSTTPLNVMVHNNTPMNVAVDVKGDRMVTSIDGQEVDSWVDDTIPAGGVGFFAEAGEKARLYWMKVSKNEDFLGRICAYVSSQLGDGTNARAEIWAPGMPGSTPRRGPGGPEGSQEAAISAAMIGIGSGRRKRHAGVSNFRSEPWSS